MENCIFCKIAKGEIGTAKVWEDENFLAFLDINPNTRGMTLLIPKKHYGSYIFDMPDKELSEMMIAGKKVAGMLEKAFGVGRVAVVMEGMGVDHVHIKLYPLHGVGKDFQEMNVSERIFFDKYQGYISTQMGPQLSGEELKKVADLIRKSVDSKK